MSLPGDVSNVATSEIKFFFVLLIYSIFLFSSLAHGADSFQQSSDSGNLVVVEAESFTNKLAQGGHDWSVFSAGAASGAIAMDSTPNNGAIVPLDYQTDSPRLDFDINFVTTGTHYVWVRGFAPNSGGDSVHIGLDNINLASTRRMDGFTFNSWEWSNQIKSSGNLLVATINVTTTGLHTLNAWMREDGYRIDKIILTTDANYVPNGTGPAESPQTNGGGTPGLPATFEFENLTVADSNGSNFSILSHGNASNGQYYLYKSNSVGNFVTFPFTVSNTGAHSLELQYYINPQSGTFEVEVAENLTGPYTQIGLMNNTRSSGGVYETLVMSSNFTSSGTKYIRLTVTGANPSTNARRMRPDKLDVTSLGDGSTNNAPIISSSGDQTSTEGDNVSLQIQAADPDINDVLAYSANGLPTGLSINNNTGLISGTVATANTFNTTVSVNDGNGGSDSTSFTWTINAASGGGTPGLPVTFEFENLTVADSNGSNFSILSHGNASNGQYYLYKSNSIGNFVTFPFTVSNTGAHSLELQYYINPHVGTFKAEVAENLAGPYTQTGVMNNTRDSGGVYETLTMNTNFTSSGTKYIRLTATGANPSTNSRQMRPDKLDVTSLDSGSSNSAPTITNINNQSNTENESVSLQAQANDSDAGDVLTYSANGLPTGLSINTNTGLISGTATTANTFNVTAIVNDGNGGSDSTSFTWTINAASGGGTPGQSTTFEFENLTVADSNGSNFSIPSHVHASNGQYYLYQSNSVGNFVTFPFTVSSTGAHTLELQYYINPQSGTFEVEVAENLTGPYTQTGVMNNTRSSGGVYETLVMSSSFTSSGTKYIRLTVTGANPSTNARRMRPDKLDVTSLGGGSSNSAPTITNISNQTNTENESVSLQAQANDSDAGDVLTYSANGLPNGLSINVNTGLISGTVTTANTFNSIVSVNDGNGGSDSVSFAWNVSSGGTCSADFGSNATTRITVPANSDPTVGSISGQHSVSTSGTSGYSIPLTLIPGTAGVEPKLSLEYSSQSPNGIFGLGFQLNGLSSVQRCGTTIVQDGASGGVDLDADDKYCIDGARLLAVSGEYGADGTLYHTEINSFNKIMSVGTSGSGPEKFQVWTKSGEVLEYGFTADSQVTINGDVVVWSLNKLSDTAGNAFNITYNYDASKKAQTPNRIEYTENESANLTADKYVEFQYEARNDDVSHLVSTTALSVDQRVSQIIVGEQLQTRKLYKFDYQDRGNDPSVLESVEECYIDNTQAEQCMPKTEFTWQLMASSNTITESQDIGHEIQDGLVGDVNGDGLADIVYFEETITGPNTTVTSSDIYFLKSTGNGFEAPVVVGSYTPVCTGTCTITPTAPFYCNVPHSPFLGAPPSPYTRTLCEAPKQLTLKDLDGDGKADLFYGNKMRFSNGDGFDVEVGHSGPIPMADMNGDGTNDYISMAGGGCAVPGGGGDDFYLHPNNNGTFSNPIYLATRYLGLGAFIGCTMNPDNPDAGLLINLGDFDGDGRADLLTYPEFPEGGFIGTYLSKGNSVHPRQWTNGFTFPKNRWMGDVNGDGRDDMVHFSSNGQIELKLGAVFGLESAPSLGAWSGQEHCRWVTNPLISPTPIISYPPYAYLCSKYSHGVGDTNGDGFEDVVIFSDSNNTSTVRVVQNNDPDVLLSVKDGFGAEVNFTYATLDDSSLYTEGTDTATYPERILHDTVDQYVVKQVIIDNGLGGTLTTSYKYENGRVHEHGYGHLGFAKVIETDEATGIQSISFNRQDYPYIGDVYRTETRIASGELLSETDVSYSLLGTVSSGPVYPYVSQQIEKTYDLDDHALISTVTTNTSIDNFGNATTVNVNTVDNSGAYATNTTNTYINNEVKWHLGRLMQATVSKTGGIENAPNRKSSFEYNSVTGFLTKEIVEAGSNFELTKTYTHDAYGNRLSVTTSGPSITSRTTSASYDSDGRFPITATNAKGHSESREYNDAWGGVTKLTGPNNLDTVWQYDAQGRKIREIRADGTETNIFYNWCNGGCQANNAAYKVTTTSTASATSVTYFDLLGREILRESESFTGESVYLTTEYDALGRNSRTSQPHSSNTPNAWTNYQYDILDRVTQENSPVTGITSSDYDGLRVTITNALSQETVEIKNSLGWTLSTTDNNNNSSTFQYDSYGNLRFVIDNEGNQTENRYSLRGFKTYMNDPDMGVWTYTYNTLGELTHQTDAKNQMVSMQYDVLGRLVQRTEPEGNTNWLYDTANYGVGKLTSESQAGGIIRNYSYDSLGRPISTNTVIGGSSYTANVTYDSFGRVDINTYPETNFQTQNIYNEVGFLEKVRNAKTNCNSAYWQANVVDDFGNVSTETLGNGVITTRDFGNASGRLFSIRSNAGNLQDLRYTWDNLGNLTQRKDTLQNYTENFLYDGLNRLTSANYVGVGVNTFVYDSIGNITNKSDVGNYTYGQGNAGPHAVTQTTGALNATYTYDANGNQLTGDNKTITWSSYNKPTLIQKGASSTAFKYGPDRARYEQTLLIGANSTTTIYVGGLFEKVMKANVTEYKHFIRAGGNTIAIYTKRTNGANDTHYMHRDHIGSIDVITDENQNIIERLSYDAFGKRRLSNWNNGLPFIVSNNTRGFTGHEMLDAVGLVHMNGRVYDPTLGRFLSADPHIQFPKNMQSLNRYSYVLNNPLSFTDPSGFFLGKLFKKIARAIKRIVRSITRAIRNFIRKYGRTLAAIALTIVVPSSYAVLAGFGSGLIASGGDLKAAVIGAITAGAFQAVGTAFEGFKNATGALSAGARVAKTVAHGVVGGLSSVAQGGKFGEGFASAGVTQAFSSQIDGISDAPGFSAQRTFAAAIVGGTASAVSGGKFANGAITGAFSRAFNDELEHNKKLNLRDHENINGSHTIKRHVGKSDEYLIDRLNTGHGLGPFKRYLSEVSTFNSLGEANNFVSNALNINKSQVAEFLASGRRTEVINQSFDSPTGKVFFVDVPNGTVLNSKPNNIQSTTGSGVRVVIRRNGNMAEGFNVHTAFPTK